MVFTRRPLTVTTRRRPTTDSLPRRTAGFEGVFARAAAASTSHPVNAMAAPMSDHSFFGQRFDFLRRHAQQLAVDVLVVLAVAGGAAVEASADVGGALAQLDRDRGDRPATDLGTGHLREPREGLELRIVLAAIPRRLTHAGGNAGALQGQHRVVAVARPRPARDERIENVLMLEPPREILETD